MNKTSVKVMIEEIESEMSKNEDLIGTINMRNEQLELAVKNLQGWMTDNQTSVDIPAHSDQMLQPIPAVADIKPKNRLSVAGKKAIRKAQKLRWQRAKFEKLGKTPLPKDKPAKKKLHWMQLPKNRKRVLAQIRKMAKKRLAA